MTFTVLAEEFTAERRRPAGGPVLEPPGDVGADPGWFGTGPDNSPDNLTTEG